MNETNIQQQRIDVLNETIAIMNRRILAKDEHRQHLNKTISNQAHQLEAALKTISTQAIELGEQGEQLEKQIDSNTNLITGIIKQDEQAQEQKGTIERLRKNIFKLHKGNINLQKEVNKLSE